MAKSPARFEKKHRWKTQVTMYGDSLVRTYVVKCICNKCGVVVSYETRIKPKNKVKPYISENCAESAVRMIMTS